MSFQLALTTECIFRLFAELLDWPSFNSHSLRSVSSVHLRNRWISYLSTRTHYGVYRFADRILTASYHLSTRTHYGVYHVFAFYLKIWKSFNSHSLRSVSCTYIQLFWLRFFQLALTTECILPGMVYGCWFVSFNSHSLRSVSAKWLNIMLQNMPFSFA